MNLVFALRELDRSKKAGCKAGIGWSGINDLKNAVLLSGGLYRSLGERLSQISREDGSQAFVVLRDHPQVIPGHSLDLDVLS
jgi:hypothetical protein